MKHLKWPVGLLRRPVGCAVVGGVLMAASMNALSLDLLQAYEAARKQDATILASRASAMAGRERLPQARAQLMPTISFSMSGNNNQLANTQPNILGEEQTVNNGYDNSNTTLTVRQPLFRTSLMAQFRQARAQVNESDASLELDEQSLVVRVSGVYFEALMAKDQLTLVLSQKATYTTQLDAARKSLIAGAGTRTDVDELVARLDMTLAQEIEARQNVEYTARQLQIMVNEPFAALAGLNAAKLELKDAEPNRLETWIDRAEQNSPEMRSRRAQVEMAEQEVNKARAGHHPTLDAVAQWTRSQSENVTNIQSRYTNSSVGLQLSVPIFSGGYVNSVVRQSLAGKERAEQALEAVRRDLGLRVHKEFRGVSESVARIKALEQAVRSSEQLVISSRKSFQAGSRTTIDVLNAEQQQAVVMRDLAQARYLYLMSKIRLLALTGGADLESLISFNNLLQP